jgi:protein-L-isoaspartate O-methyltransferase
LNWPLTGAAGVLTTATDAELRHRLVLRLQGAGAIQSEERRRAFETVPRHRLLPRVTRTLDYWRNETSPPPLS